MRRVSVSAELVARRQAAWDKAWASPRLREERCIRRADGSAWVLIWENGTCFAEVPDR